MFINDSEPAYTVYVGMPAERVEDIKHRLMALSVGLSLVD